MISEPEESSSAKIEVKNFREQKACSFNLDESLLSPSLAPIRNVLAHVLKLASERDEIVVVCGTTFIMSDVRNLLLGIMEPRDEIE